MFDVWVRAEWALICVAVKVSVCCVGQGRVGLDLCGSEGQCLMCGSGQSGP